MIKSPAMTVRDNLDRILEAMERAAERSGRSPSGVRLVAASKTVPADRMLEAARAGVRIFGENRIQEALSKMKAVEWPADISWHFIGHLQKNKARTAAKEFRMVESVDDLDLARALDRHAGEAGRRLPILVEINVGGELSKGGFDPDGIEEAVPVLAGLSNLRLEGLMAIPPYTENPEDARPYFRRMREILERLNHQGAGLTELSMGMSHDFEVAIEEGATLVRIGTALFGAR